MIPSCFTRSASFPRLLSVQRLAMFFLVSVFSNIYIPNYPVSNLRNSCKVISRLQGIQLPESSFCIEWKRRLSSPIITAFADENRQYGQISPTVIYAPFWSSPVSATQEYLPAPPVRNYTLNETFRFAAFLTLGDWGKPRQVQRLVANQLSVAASLFNPQFLLSLGDNFYEFGLTDVNETRWKTVFEDVYNATSLVNLPFLSVLGNHDYRGNPWVQVARTYAPYNHRWYMPNYWFYERFEYNNISSDLSKNPFVKGTNIATYTKDMLDEVAVDPAGKTSVVYIFLDTIIMAMKDPRDLLVPYDMNVPELLKKHVEFLKNVLKAAVTKADWIFVVGHYHLLTHDVRDEIQSMKKILLPLFTKYKVDAYLNGHRHYLSMYEGGNITFINSGAASKKSIEATCQRPNGCLYIGSTNGFSIQWITQKRMFTTFVDKNGEILYTHAQTHRDKTSADQKDIPFPPIRRIYVGPNPADASPRLKVFTLLGLGAGGGFVVGVLLVICAAGVVVKMKQRREYIPILTEMTPV